MPDEPDCNSERPEPEHGSDRPPDLGRKRDQVLSRLGPGSHVTEEMIAERVRLEEQIRSLEVENAKLRARVEVETAVMELLRRIERLEAEKQALVLRVSTAHDGSQTEDHFSKVEADFANLASLYVASTQLHSSMSPRRVARCIQEIVNQLLGAERYALYVVSEDGSELVPVAAEGVSLEPLGTVASLATAVGRAYTSGRTAHNEDSDPSHGTLENPAAVVPLWLDDRVFGVLSIVSTLPQKTSFRPLDYELFKLLGRHAALALAGASLFAAAGRKLPNLEPLVDVGL